MKDPSPRLRSFRPGILLVVTLLVVFWIMHDKLGVAEQRRVSYSEVTTAVEAGKVARAELTADEVFVTLRRGDGAEQETLVASRIPNVDERALLEMMQERGVVVTGHAGRPWWEPLVWSLPMLGLPMLLFWMLAMQGAAARGKPLTFGKSQAKIYDRSRENPVTFQDVAGVDEAKGELTEIVRFLKEPERYRAVGARIPKGVLLVGAPGTGKTLLAKAVAGESGVPFFSISGSEFVEMFVGVGASRARDLFEQAKQRAPCIIFIDELDAVGKARAGAIGFAANEEREQTLNQLLVEMDGFDSGTGLVIMAATNRPEILDRALLRAGRFDRQVLVDRPDVRGREAILRVHARKVQLGADVDLKIVAQRTPGMVGADLANVVNEAALASVRRDGAQIDAVDFEEAIDRIQLGLKKEGRVMTDDERRRVAVHEAGHALLALSMKHADPVHRVTIIARSIGALGATLQLPTAERYLMTRDELRDRICVLLGGRTAEELACGDISSGAQDDLARATEMARQMVCRFGMSDRLGPIAFSPQGVVFVPWDERSEARNVSEATARTIDEEVRGIVMKEYDRARTVLSSKRPALDALVAELLVHETIDRRAIEAITARDDLRRASCVAISPSLR